MPRKSNPRTVPPNFRLKIWKQEGALYYADPEDLAKAIATSGVPPEIIVSRMGHGHHHIQDALDGERLDRWAVAHIEAGLFPVTSQKIC